MLPTSLPDFINILRENNQLVEISAPVDPYLEIAEIHRRVIAAGGPALLFNNVKGKSFSVVTNLFGQEKRVELAFGPNTLRNTTELANFAAELPPTWQGIWRNKELLSRFLRLGTAKKHSFFNKLTDNWATWRPTLKKRQESGFRCITDPDVTILPATTSWKTDGGAFLTLPLVQTKDIESGKDNLGIYRMQIFSAQETGMHFQIGKGGGYHLHLAEQKRQDLPVNVYLGGPPALILAAIAPLPENISELLLCSFLLGRRLATLDNPHGELDLLADAEFCLSGVVPAGVRRTEGPFGDHYGYNSLRHDFPVFRPRVIFHKENAIFPATVVGKPKQEDFFLGDYLQKLLLPIIPLVMPAVKDLWSYGECGYHSLAACVLRERYEREALTTAFRILGEGQLALTKFLLCVDRNIDLQDFAEVLTYVLQRADFSKDLHVFAKTAMDTLDYTGESLNKGSKGVLLGIGQQVRELPEIQPALTTTLIKDMGVFCPGCLVLQSSSHQENPQIFSDILQMDAFKDWPLLVLVDDVAKTLKSQGSFVWTTFTRFNPATDIHAKKMARSLHKITYTEPILIDARLKSWYPPELFCDHDTKKLVDKRWNEYFPGVKVEMGSGDQLSV